MPDGPDGQHLHAGRLHLRRLEHRADGSGTDYADGATYAFSADITLYAQWTALPNHTVTFNATAAPAR